MRLSLATSRRFMAWALLALAVLGLMKGWMTPGVPLSPRGENLPELNYIWLCRHFIEAGHPLTGWNPIDVAGSPTFSGHQHPLALLLAWLSVALGLNPDGLYKAVVFCCFVMGAWGTYEYAFYITHSGRASLIAALAFALFPAQVIQKLETLAFNLFWSGVPWLFYSYEKARDDVHWKRGNSIVPGVVLAYLAVVSNYQLLLLSPFFGLYVLAREGQRFAAGERNLMGVARLLALTGGLGIGLSFFYSLPTLVEARYQSLSLEITQVPMDTSPWMSLSPLLLRRLFYLRWSPLFQPYAFDIFKGTFPNITWYLGTAVIVLALFSLWHRRRGMALSLWLLALTALLFAIGPNIPNNPVYNLSRRTPLLARTVKMAFRGMFPATFALSVLAGMGFASWERRVKGRRATLLLGLALVAIVADYSPSVAAFDAVESCFYPDEAAAYRWLNEETGGFRYWTPVHYRDELRNYNAYQCGIRHTTAPRLSSELPVRYFWAPYHIVRAMERGLRGMERGGVLEPLGKVVLSLASVKYVVIHTRSPLYSRLAEALARHEGWPVAWRTEHVSVLENPLVRPYVQLYAAVVLARTEEEELALLERWPLRGVAVLPQDDDPGDIPRAPGEAWTPLQPSVSWSRPHPEIIRVNVNLRRPGILVVSESWYPHWHVYVDGEEKRLLRANYAFMGVKLEAGEHEVEFRYHKPWYLGLAYAVTALVSLILLARLARMGLKKGPGRKPSGCDH